MKRVVSFLIFAISLVVSETVDANNQWFEHFKKTASNKELYQFLYAMPKGGDLHNHLTGSNLSEWWWDAAINPEINGGYEYFTKVRINNCVGYGTDMFGFSPYLLLFRNIQKSTFDALDICEQSEFKKIAELTIDEKTAWLDSLRLDKPHESRDEFFQTHWQRLNDLGANPHINAHMMVKNMEAFGREGLMYIETQEGAQYYKKPDGSFFEPAEVVTIFKKRLQQPDAKKTGVTLRMQYYLLRFTPTAEQDLEWIYQFVANNRDLFVGINMVGREDNDKGYPLRFLPTLRKMRHKLPNVPLAIHAGEVDEPNQHVRDTLLLGATRIGHGVNLISDPETMLLMRHSDYLVEINLISNLKLNYVSDFPLHPFPEYLRFGIPVALSTDDRGMWDSNMTDEYFVAVKEFNLSWDEIITVSRNSLKFSFVEAPLKERLLKQFDERISTFEKIFKKQGLNGFSNIKPETYSFMCQQYQVCNSAF